MTHRVVGGLPKLKEILIMKKLIVLSVAVVAMSASAAKLTGTQITGVAAKSLYESLTGPEVVADAGMGHEYVTGKNVSCSYLALDVRETGLPRTSPKRYSCTIVTDANGVAQVAN